MAPGTYLERRRVMAGYSIQGLARDLIALTGFATHRTITDLHRLHATLMAAEQGALHHSPERIDVIRNFVPLDPTVYFRLIKLDRHMPGLTVHGVCRVCACSFHDPCTMPVDPAAGLGDSTCCWVEADLCSVCHDFSRRADKHAAEIATASRSSIAEQLRELSEKIARINREGFTTDTTNAEPPFLRIVPSHGDS